MVDPKHQLFLNISSEDAKSRVTFSQLTWLGLVLLAAIIGFMRGTPAWLAGSVGCVFLLPVLVWALGRSWFSLKTFDELYIISWGLVVFAAMALGGGALTALTAVLVLGPMACIVLGRVQLAIPVATLSLIAYGLAILAGAHGWARVAPAGWQGLVPALGVATLVQIVILIWAIEPQLRAVKAAETAELIRNGVAPKNGLPATVFQMPEKRDLKLTLPLILLCVAEEGRIRRIEGQQELRWPGLKLGQTVDTALGEFEGDVYERPGGREFSVLRGEHPDGGHWIGLVPVATDSGETAKQIEALETSLKKALAFGETAKADLADRTAFFAGLGHDLKTPLNAILGFADLMKAEVRGPLPEAYKDYPAIIHESGQDLMLLVDDILDLAKSEASGHRLDMEPVDLVASAASVVRQLEDQAERAGVKLDLKNDGEVWAEADARAVRQIWQNLVSNAIKYSNDGGAVTLSAGKAAGSVAISVKDRGAGMDREDLDRIATPFAQGTNSKGRAGTGLGLAVVHRFAKLHGGKVVIDTEKGKGTRVRVTLPALDVSQLGRIEDAAK